MKTLLLFILPAINALLWTGCGRAAAASSAAEETQADTLQQKLTQHSRLLKQYAATNNANTTYGVLIDMSLPSWQNRFFVVDLQHDTVLFKGQVAHGQGDDYRREEVVFSNVVGSNCTSEGRYRIGLKYNGDFGLAYKLHGLDTTNSNAFKRFVVFHSHSCVQDVEGSAICRSDGCPTVSPYVLRKTAALIDSADKPLLMWIYK